MKLLYPSLVLMAAVACGGPLPGKSSSDTGESTPPDDVVEFGGVQILPASFAFGDVEIGATAHETLIIDNDSPDTITVSTAFTEGTGFTLGTDLSFPVELTSGAIATTDVSFSPPTLGPFSGTLSVGIAGVVGYAELPLRGAGIEEGSGTDSGSSPAAGTMTTFPEELAFGPVAVAETSWRTLQLTNTGDGDLLVTRLTSSNTFVFHVEPDFSVPISISAGQTQTVQVGFSPFELRDYTAVLDIDADTAEGGILVPLAGTGSESSCEVCAPNLSVATSTGGGDTLSLSPPSGMGCTANGAVTLSNTGDMPLTISSLTLNNDLISTCGTFSYSWAGALTLEAAESTTIGVDFVATSTCMESAYPSTDQNILHILSNDPTTADWRVGLTASALYCGG
jgi:hypothetical protein